MKSKRPVSMEQKELNKKARLTMVTGELNKDELKRKTGMMRICDFYHH